MNVLLQGLLMFKHVPYNNLDPGAAHWCCCAG